MTGRGRRALRIGALVGAAFVIAALLAGCAGSATVIAPSTADRSHLGVALHDGGPVLAAQMLGSTGPASKQVASLRAAADAKLTAKRLSSRKPLTIGTKAINPAPVIEMTPYSLRLSVLADFSGTPLGINSVDVMESFVPLASGERLRSLAVTDSGGVYAASDRALYVWPITGSDPLELSKRTVGLSGGYDMRFADDGLWVADGTGGAKLLDLSEPATPTVTAVLKPRPDVDVRGAAAEASVAVLTDRAGGRLYVYDVSDPAAPSLVGSAAVDTPDKVVVTAGYAYVAAADSVRVFAVTGPDAPNEVASVALPGAPSDIQLTGTAIAASVDATVYPISIDTPADPVLGTGIGLGHPVVSLRDAGSFGALTAAEGTGGWDAFSLEGGGVHMDYPVASKDVAKWGDYAYVADGEYGLKVESLYVGAVARTIATLPATDSVSVEATAGWLFEADDGHLKKYDLSVDPGAPELTGDLPVGDVRDLAVSDRYVFLAAGSDGLVVASNDLPAPDVVSRESEAAAARSVAATGSLALVGRTNGDLDVFDVSDGASPQLLGSVQLPGAARGITIVGSIAEAAAGDAGAVSVDIEDPSHPVIVDTFGTPGVANAIAANEERAIVADGDSARWLSTEDTAALEEIGHYGPMPALGVALDGLPLVAAGEQGMFELSPAETDPVARIDRVTQESPLKTAPLLDDSAFTTTVTVHALLTEADGFPPTEYEYAFFDGSYKSGSIDETDTYDNVPGKHSIELYSRTIGGESAAASAEFRIVAPQRTGGANRVLTALAISQRSFPSSSTTEVVIARADGFADALTGAPLAAQLNAPILLVRDTVTPEVAAEIQRLGATHAVVLGDSKAVPSHVDVELRSAMGTTAPAAVERLGGLDRFDTARLIAQRLMTLTGSKPHTVFVSTAWDFADAVSVSGIAAYQRSPILLTQVAGVPKPTRDAMASLTPSETILIGSSRVTPASPYLPGAARLGGATRFDTSRLIAEYALANGFDASRVYVATGRQFADALAAAPVSAGEKAPIILVEPASLPPASRAFFDAHHRDILEVEVLGSDRAVSDGVLAKILAVLHVVTP